MKKLIPLLTFVILMAIGCTNEKPAGYTVLGDYTPYEATPEKLIGKVEKVIEKNYWAIPDGETFKKGNPFTIKDRDSINWTNDFEVTFNDQGGLVSCNYIDENGKSILKWELSRENGLLTSARATKNDTARMNEKIKCNPAGEITEIAYYRPVADTLIATFMITCSEKKDTVTKQFYNYKGGKGGKIVYIYNDGGRFLRQETYDMDGAFTGSIEVKYNEKGKNSELEFYDKDKKLTAVNHFTYEYDQKGNWIKAVTKDDRGFVVIEERTYAYFE